MIDDELNLRISHAMYLLEELFFTGKVGVVLLVCPHISKEQVSVHVASNTTHKDTIGNALKFAASGLEDADVVSVPMGGRA